MATCSSGKMEEDTDGTGKFIYEQMQMQVLLCPDQGQEEGMSMSWGNWVGVVEVKNAKERAEHRGSGKF